MPKRPVPSIVVPWVKPSTRIEARRALAVRRGRETASTTGIALEQRMLGVVNIRALFGCLDAALCGEGV